MAREGVIVETARLGTAGTLPENCREAHSAMRPRARVCQGLFNVVPVAHCRGCPCVRLLSKPELSAVRFASGHRGVQSSVRGSSQFGLSWRGMLRVCSWHGSWQFSFRLDSELDINEI